MACSPSRSEETGDAVSSETETDGTCEGAVTGYGFCLLLRPQVKDEVMAALTKYIKTGS